MPTIPYVGIGRLLIECPPAIRAEFTSPALPDAWFETVGSVEYLRVWCDRSKYSRIEELADLNFVDSLASTISPIATARVGFEATIEEENADQLYLIRRIARNCTASDLRTLTPLTVLDFVRPEEGDRVAAEGLEFYTPRVGRFLSIQEDGGMVGRFSQRYSKGFTLRFLERDKRRTL